MDEPARRRGSRVGRRPDPVRGAAQRAHRDHRGDGGEPPAQRLLDQHQDPRRLLVRILRRRRCARSPSRSRSRATSARSCGSCPPRSATTAPSASDPGDAILVNHPYIGGGHLNDVTLIAPFFHDGEILGYVACLAHHVDVGGGAPASVGSFREVFQEGDHHPAGQARRRRRDRHATSTGSSSSRSAPSARPPATCAPRSPATTPASAGSPTLVDQLGARALHAPSSTSCSPTRPGGPRPRSRRFHEASSRPTGSSTPTATRDEPGPAARQGRHRRRRRPVRPERLATSSGARRSTRPTPRPTPTAPTSCGR